jgi:phosphoenolpyruvate-protein phosphotransferase
MNRNDTGRGCLEHGFERRLSGLAIGPGVAVGPVFGTQEAPTTITRHRIAAADIEAEGARLDAAVALSRKQLGKLRARLAVLPEDSQAEIAPLLDAYVQMLGPSRLLRGARRRISETLRSAEQAVIDEAEAIATALMAASPDDLDGATRRADEVREIARRLVRNLTRAPFRSFAGLPPGAILVAEWLTPADAALLDPARVAAVATEEGGLDGHTAIMLRALGIPTVLGVMGLTAHVETGRVAVVDGTAGLVILEPTPATLLTARRAVIAFARRRQRWGRLRRLPAVTLCGTEVALQANLELPAELPLVAQSGAHGVGLLRSEFLFMNRDDLPDEQAQTEIYTTVVEAMEGDPVTIRVLDWGGEKEIEALAAAGVGSSAGDANPALGLRGIRMLLRHRDLLETQFAAILRAAAAGPVRVMLPMVTNMAEVREARAIYHHTADVLRARGVRLPEKLPPLGAMVEVPAAALAADGLATVADFFAIGSNDLTMYTLAADRADTEAVDLYNPTHPAVLRLIVMIVAAGARSGIDVSLCGEMAANARLAPLLLGLGIRSFSMNATAVPRVKQAVRTVRLDACEAFAADVMREMEPDAVALCIKAFHDRSWAPSKAGEQPGAGLSDHGRPQGPA